MSASSAFEPAGDAVPAEAKVLRRWVAVLILSGSSLFWLALILHTTGPLVPTEEYVHLMRGLALDSTDRLAATATPSLGGYLFLRLINLAGRTGLPLELTLKLFNLVCFGGATLLVGAQVLRRGQPWRAATLYALVAALPIGSCVAYVAPQSAYLLVFVVLVSCLLAAPTARPYRLWALAGALIALLTLVKSDGLFVLAAFLGATGLWSALTGRVSLFKAAGLVLTCAAAFAVALALGAWCFGPRGGAPLHELWGSAVLGQVGQATANGALGRDAAGLAALLAAAVLLLLAPALTYLAFGVVADHGVRRRNPSSTDLLSFCACFLIGFTVVAIVTAVLLGAAPDRLQLSGAAFAIPCVLALAWIWQSVRPEGDTRAFRFAAAAAWLLAGAVFLWRLPGLRPSPADSPEMFFSYRGGEFGAFGLGAATTWVVAGLLVAGAGALLHPKVRWFDVQVLALLVFFGIADANIVTWQARWSLMQVPLRAVGEAARLACGSGPGDVVAIGPPAAAGPLYAALAGFGRPVMLRRPPGSVVDPKRRPGPCVITTLPGDALWGAPLAAGGGVSLYKPPTAWGLLSEVPFGGGVRPAMLGDGWSVPETRGIWTDGPLASLRLNPALVGADASTVVAVDALAFSPPPGSGQRVEVSSGGRVLTTWFVQDGIYYVRLPRAAGPERPVELDFRLPDAAAPAATLPGALDRRLLGIAVRRVRVLRPASDLAPSRRGEDRTPLQIPQQDFSGPGR